MYNTDMRTQAKIFGLLCIAVLILTGITPVEAQTPTPPTNILTLNGTNHTIRGKFLDFWNSVPDPLLVFGYPITEEMTDSLGQHYQYFQRARLDLVDTPNGAVVQLAPLGSWLYESGSPLADYTPSGLCQTFPTYNKTVCHDFLVFYYENGGEAIFGEPISELEYQDGTKVQYFEYARMEWRGEKPQGEKVVLTDVGRLYFDQIIGNPDLLYSTTSSSIINTQKITAHAFVQSAIVRSGDTQTAYVVVQNQDYQAVAGANITAYIDYPDGRPSDIIRPPSTSLDGFTSFSFKVADLPTGKLVRLRIEADTMGLSTSAVTSFRIWW